MRNFTERIDAATDTNDPNEYIARVKAIVAEEIRKSDPSINLVDTGYYTNSFIPDFEATWDGNKDKRPVFLRNELADVIAARDTEYLPAKEPVILTLDTKEVNEKIVSEAKSQATLKPRALIATGTSFNSDIFEYNKNSNTSPLENLVRTNFIRGAKGVITPATVDSFIKSEDPKDGNNFSSLDDHTISSYFDSQTAFRINTMKNLLQFSSMSPDEIMKNLDSFELISELKIEEIEWILPILLHSNNPLPKLFWQKIGSLFNLSQLEKISTSLDNINLTDLIEANLESWTARRAYSGLLISNEKTPLLDNKNEYWTFNGKILSKCIPEESRKICIAWDPKKLKRNSLESSRSWDQTKNSIADYTLLEVNLKGIKRTVSINAIQSTDIRKDVKDITESVEDKYLISSVVLGLKNTEEEVVRADVQLGESLIIADSEVTLNEITEAATSIFSHRKTSRNEE